MKKFAISTSIAALILGLFLTTQSYATSFYVSTDFTSYSGILTKYDTLSDAQNHTNAVGGPYSIPNRDTAAPYNTGSRDLTLFMVSNQPDYYNNYTQIMTSWYYTTADNTNIDPNTGNVYPKGDPNGDRYYSGYGNPNNTNTGFLQIADAGNTTVTGINGNFGAFDGTYYTTFSLQVSGQNADYANSWARLWPAPAVGGVGELSSGTFISYSLDATFGGLQGTAQNGMITATGQPTSVTGTFEAIFQNTNITDPTYNGFYTVDFTLGMDNWAYGQTDLNGPFFTSEFGAPVPLPGTLLLLGSGLTGLVLWRRRKAAVKN